MSKRLLSIIAVLALVVAACGGGQAEETTTTASAADPTTTTTQAPSEPEALEAQLLSYSFEVGTLYEYEVDLFQHIEMTSSVEGPVTSETEDLPGEASIDLSGSAIFTYAVAAGTDEGTYEITIIGEFTDLDISGTYDGVSIDSLGEAPDMTDLAGIDPVDVIIIVDEQGNLIVDGEVVDDPLSGMFGDLGSLGTPSAPGLDPGQFIGVPLPESEVGVGDSWTEEIEVPGFGDDPIVTTVTSTVTAIDGGVYTIETETSTSLIEFDLGEFFIGLLTAFGSPEGAEAAEFDAMISQIRFLMTIDETDSESTTSFDAEAGIVTSYALDAGAHITMDINVPDETTGELSGMNVDMRMSQRLDYILVSGPSA
jgi:hypothetical protein